MSAKAMEPASRSAAQAAPPSVRSIHAAIRREIVNLHVRPGERLSENDLAARFGTSRAPVREALIRLAEEGLITVLPQRGSFVSRISLAAMERARFVREALERAAVRNAAERGAGPEVLARASAAIADQQRAGRDPALFTQADDAFHRALSEASGVAHLWTVIEREKAQLDRVRFLSLPSATPVDVLVAQHRAILTAIERRDTAAADEAMRQHLSEVQKIARRLAAEHPDLIVDDV